MKIPTIEELVKEADILSLDFRKELAKHCKVEKCKLMRWLNQESVPDAKHALLILEWVINRRTKLKYCASCNRAIKAKDESILRSTSIYHLECYAKKMSRHREKVTLIGELA